MPHPKLRDLLRKQVVELMVDAIQVGLNDDRFMVSYV